MQPGGLFLPCHQSLVITSSFLRVGSAGPPCGAAERSAGKGLCPGEDGARSQSFTLEFLLKQQRRAAAAACLELTGSRPL